MHSDDKKRDTLYSPWLKAALVTIRELSQDKLAEMEPEPLQEVRNLIVSLQQEAEAFLTKNEDSTTEVQNDDFISIMAGKGRSSKNFQGQMNEEIPAEIAVNQGRLSDLANQIPRLLSKARKALRDLEVKRFEYEHIYKQWHYERRYMQWQVAVGRIAKMPRLTDMDVAKVDQELGKIFHSSGETKKEKEAWARLEEVNKHRLALMFSTEALEALQSEILRIQEDWHLDGTMYFPFADKVRASVTEVMDCLAKAECYLEGK